MHVVIGKIWPELRKILLTLSLVSIISAIVLILVVYAGVTRAASAFLIPIVVAAIRWGLPSAITAAVAGVVASVYILYPPIYDFRITDPQEYVDLALYILIAIIVSRLAAQLSAERVRAEANVLRQALVDSISHELRTPLASILGSATVLGSAQPLQQDERLMGLVTGIREETERLDRQIQILMQASRVGAESIQPQKELVDPTDIINSALIQRRRHLRSHALELQIAEDLPFLHVDAAMIEQALIQIVDNAVKYSPPSSCIGLIARADNGNVTIAVSDQGVGFTGQELGRASERFFRGERHTGVTGSGLGLWIAKAFVIANNGTLKVTSPGQDQGSTILITLPKAKTPAQKRKADTAHDDE